MSNYFPWLSMCEVNLLDISKRMLISVFSAIWPTDKPDEPCCAPIQPEDLKAVKEIATPESHTEAQQKMEFARIQTVDNKENMTSFVSIHGDRAADHTFGCGDGDSFDSFINNILSSPDRIDEGFMTADPNNEELIVFSNSNSPPTASEADETGDTVDPVGTDVQELSLLDNDQILEEVGNCVTLNCLIYFEQKFADLDKVFRECGISPDKENFDPMDEVMNMDSESQISTLDLEGMVKDASGAASGSNVLQTRGTILVEDISLGMDHDNDFIFETSKIAYNSPDSSVTSSVDGVSAADLMELNEEILTKRVKMSPYPTDLVKFGGSIADIHDVKFYDGDVSGTLENASAGFTDDEPIIIKAPELSKDNKDIKRERKERKIKELISGMENLRKNYKENLRDKNSKIAEIFQQLATSKHHKNMLKEELKDKELELDIAKKELELIKGVLHVRN